MANTITQKTIKEHAECACGFGFFEQYTDRSTIKQLKDTGFKKRKFKDSGLTFYFLKYQTICDQCNDEIFNEPNLT